MLFNESLHESNKLDYCQILLLLAVQTGPRAPASGHFLSRLERKMAWAEAESRAVVRENYQILWIAVLEIQLKHLGTSVLFAIDSVVIPFKSLQNYLLSGMVWYWE